MNDILQQIMDMIETTRTIPSVSSISMIGFAVLLIFGIINCVLGYRLLRFWMMLCGFVIGAGIGFGIAFSSGVTEKYMYAAFMVGAGVVIAVIAFVSYKIGLFILGAGIGIGLGIYVFHPTTSLVFFFCLLLGVGLGVLAMKQARVVLIVGTSLLGGAMAGFSAAKLGGLADIPYGIGLSAGFALLGMVIQFATNRRADDDEDEDDEEEYADSERSSDYVDFRDYVPQKAERKTGKESQRKTKNVRREPKEQEQRERVSQKQQNAYRKPSRSSQQVDFKLEKNNKRRHRSDDVAPESEKTIPYRPRKSRQKEIDLPLGSFDYEDAYIPEEPYEEPVEIDEDELDEEVLREMMEDDDREGEELWKKISRRDDARKKRNKSKRK